MEVCPSTGSRRYREGVQVKNIPRIYLSGSMMITAINVFVF